MPGCSSAARIWRSSRNRAIVGPALSGWLVINYGWRWIFYINAPVGLVSFVACYALLEDPEYLRQERAELKKRPLNFDGIGLGLRIKKQRAAADTWLAEANYRDRGPVD